MDELTEDYAILPPPPRTEPCKLYLISLQDVGGTFPDRLKAALGAAPVAAFQMRVRMSTSTGWRGSRTLQRICA